VSLSPSSPEPLDPEPLDPEPLDPEPVELDPLVPLSDPLESSSTDTGLGTEAPAVAAGRGATGCGPGMVVGSTTGADDGAEELVGPGDETLPEPIPPLPSSGAVEIGGTSAVVVESTSGMAWATPMAPDAITPRLSAEIAETVIQVGAGAMGVCSRQGSRRGLRISSSLV
jgi:hypothetical protein